MNEFYIQIKLKGDDISNVVAFGRRNNHDCWNTWIGDWTKVCSGKTISECKNNLRDYLEKEDKGKLTIDSILSKIQIKS